MKNNRVLNIKGAILDKNQLESYLEKIASDHILKNKSDKNTYPVPRVKENFEYIYNIYKLLNEHLKMGIPIHPAGEWVLDNFYVIEKTVKTISKELSLKKYVNFLGIANGAYRGFARIFVLAQEIIAYTDANIDSNNLQDLIKAYQNKKTLNMEEIWNIGLFMEIALIENIRGICEKIYSSQIQKYHVESIIERLVENKQKLKFKNLQSRTKLLGYGQMKYPFIEYMSYRLKSYGKKAYSYLNILEEQVNKMGTDVYDVIQKEHFDIAVKKISMGNSINSINNIIRMNILEIFEEINGVEEVLKRDPVNVYERMDYKTKSYYRNEIQNLSKKTKVAEMYIAKKCLELAEQNYDNNDTNKKAHIGYYLICKGRKRLINELLNEKPIIEKKNRKSKNNKNSEELKVKCYISIIFSISIFLTIFFMCWIYNQINSLIPTILLGVFNFILIESIITQILQYMLSKIVKPKLIPKLNFENGIPEECTTIVVIPTIVKSGEKVKEFLKKLEVFYMANKSENLYFCLLGDCSSGSKEIEKFDEKIIKAGIEETQMLNKKYPDEKYQKFNFIYRNRTWNSSEECFLGWERKRGLLSQFNEYILGKSKNVFRVNTFEELEKLPKIKYVITLDSDTDLTLNTGLELVGAMAHVLNIPVLDCSERIVVEGHGILQPRIGINLPASRKSLFTKIFANNSGTDLYTNAVSDVYQDNFEQGTFTGKGIYDLEVFSKLLKNEIPENTVLSHDLLEGCYLRSGLVTDIILMDGYPSSYIAFKSRNHRWIRGDYQIVKWLKNSYLNRLSKYKILDNILRSLLEISAIISIVFVCILNILYKIKIWPIILLSIITIVFPTILEFINKILFKKQGQKKQKTFSNTFTGMKSSFFRGMINFAVLPDKAYTNLNACCKTIYRMCESKKHLLEWITADEMEGLAKRDIKSYYKNMWVNLLFGVLGLLFLFMYEESVYRIIILTISLIWIIAPGIMCYISQTKYQNKKEIINEDKEYLLNIGKKTWGFFKEYINESNNFLPPDNYQQDRTPKIIERTSPTNIGLGLLAVISSYNLGFEKKEDTLILLEKMIFTIKKLQKWNGHLYNWYDTQTLKPLIPRYISSVDSGNFIGYLYVVKQFLLKKCKEGLVKEIEKIIDDTDFSKLYSEKTQMFSIGFNVEENKLTNSYYDLLASEARQTSLIAIAKKDVPVKHWNNLSRTLTVVNKYKGLISWSGTSFEYLMPNINIPQYESSLLEESCKFMIMSQIEYTKRLGVPWGISESAFNLKDLNNNYQYKAFGIPWLGLKRGLADEIVVSSYGSIIALPQEPEQVIKNLKILEDYGMLDKYGFYESIDFTPSRLRKNKKSAVVKTYMAHHQGLILTSINNFFNNNILQKLFMENPEIQSIDILLQEKMPENVIITKEKKEKIEKIKYIDYENYIEKTYTKPNDKINGVNVIANNDYTIVLNQKGGGFSKYKDVLINRFKPTSETDDGIYFYIKNINTKKIWVIGHKNNQEIPEKYKVCFAPDKAKFSRTDGGIETIQTITTGLNEPVELRRIKIINHGNNEEILEITSVLEPVLSTKEQDYSHMAFNNLFLTYELIPENNTIIIKRKNRTNKKEDVYLGVNLYTPDEKISDIEYEISKEKLYGRTNYGIPESIKNSRPLSSKIGLTVNPVLALKRSIKIKPNQTIIIDYIMCVSNDREKVIETMEEYLNCENIKRTFELSKARMEEETRFLKLTGKNIELYQKLLGYIIFPKSLKAPKNISMDEIYPVETLWKYGVSGDLPILLVKIKNVNDIRIIDDIIKAYEFFRIKNINVDLVILNEEAESYENYVTEGIQNSIFNKNISYLQNIKGGIFVLKNIAKEDKKVFEIRANLTIDSRLGNIESQLDELEEEFIENNAQINIIEDQDVFIQEKTDNENQLINQNLKYYNEYGGFSEDGKEYKIRLNKNEKLPTVWSHIICNENFGTLVTENMGGYTWYKNSKLNKISAWSNDQVLDTPSEIIYLKDEATNAKWTIGASPMPDENDYYVTYGFGYAKYEHLSNEIMQTLKVFVPKNDNVKINLISLKNMLPKKKKLKIFYYLKPVLDEDEIKSSNFINLKFNQLTNVLSAKNIINSDYQDYIYISSSEKINSYTGNKKYFFGNGNISNPDGIKIEKLNNENSLKKDGIIVIQFDVELEAFETKEISISIGIGEDLKSCEHLAYKYSNIENCIQEVETNKKFWTDLLNKVQVQTPVESMNILLNGWMIYQTLCSRILGRAGFYQAGGAYGFRDQLQDSICLKYINPELMKNQIILHANHQFMEGDVVHWWHEEICTGIRTRFSDDLLWLPYTTADYIEFTGDLSILDIEANYISAGILEEGVDELYDKYEKIEIKEDIYNHCIRAIEKSLKFGENGLPKIGSGDWNDGFSTVGNKGKGESIWLGFFLYDILNKFIPICEIRGDKERIEKYKNIVINLKKHLNSSGWDGRWYRRAYMDNGDVLGSIENEECKIDSIAQSWSIISKAGDNDKKYISIESLENHLIDKENGIIKLLDPPFENGKLEPGYIKSYLPGTRENGGQYTHAAIWVIIAETILGFGNKACELFRMINPIEHSRTKTEAEKYKVEPFVIPADVYGQGNLAGRGGWTWYTGSSSWFYEAGIKYILGLQIEKNILKINPCISSEWKEYSIRYNYGTSIYNIKVKNPNGKNSGVEKFVFNGNEVIEKQIKLVDTGSINEIEITL